MRALKGNGDKPLSLRLFLFFMTEVFKNVRTENNQSDGGAWNFARTSAARDAEAGQTSRHLSRAKISSKSPAPSGTDRARELKKFAQI